jgi:hypothetical protein
LDRKLAEGVLVGVSVGGTGAASVAVKGAGPRRLLEVLIAGADGNAAIVVGAALERRLWSNDSTVSSRCSID